MCCACRCGRSYANKCQFPDWNVRVQPTQISTLYRAVHTFLFTALDLLFIAELALLQVDAAFASRRARITEIASLLEALRRPYSGL